MNKLTNQLVIPIKIKRTLTLCRSIQIQIRVNINKEVPSRDIEILSVSISHRYKHTENYRNGLFKSLLNIVYLRVVLMKNSKNSSFFK